MQRVFPNTGSQAPGARSGRGDRDEGGGVTFHATPEHDPHAWRKAALCLDADTDLFFTDDPARKAAAKLVCRHCPSLAPCLAFALSTNQEGVWGATDDKDRGRLRKDRSMGYRAKTCTDCGVEFRAQGGKYMRCEVCSARHRAAS